MRGERKTSQEKNREIQIQNLRENFFSVFIDNIPFGKDEKWLGDLFNKDGPTMDVFIPARERRASRSRFGFVRYKSLGEAEAAIRRWNGTRVGNTLLEVKLADVGGKPRASQVKEGWARGVFSGVKHTTPRSVSDWVPVKRGEDQGHLAFVEDGTSKVLNGTRRLLKLKTVPEHVEWFQKCAVAVLKIDTTIENIEKELLDVGFNFLKVLSMGGGKVLIHFASVEELERCLSEIFSSSLKSFDKIQAWREEELMRSRSVWLSIIGLPFKAWSEDNFELIAAAHGSYVRRDVREFRITGIGRARILIETTKMDRISEVVEAEISGKVYEINVVEDCFLNGCEVGDDQNGISLIGVDDHLSSNHSQHIEPEAGSVAIQSPPLSPMKDGSRKVLGEDHLELLRSVQGEDPVNIDLVEELGQGVLAEEGCKRILNDSSRCIGSQKSEEVSSRSRRGMSSLKVSSKAKFFGAAIPEKQKRSLWIDNRREGQSSFEGNPQLGQSHEECVAQEDESLESNLMSLKALKIARRKDSKEKGIIKYKRRKEKGVLDGLKRAYMRNLETCRRLNQGRKLFAKDGEELQSWDGSNSANDQRRDADPVLSASKEAGPNPVGIKAISPEVVLGGEELSSPVGASEKLHKSLEAKKRKSFKGKGVEKQSRRSKSRVSGKKVIEESRDKIKEREIADASKTLELAERLGVKFIGKKEDILQGIIKVSRR